MAEQTAVSETTRRVARNAVIRAAAEILGKVATLAWTVAAARSLGAGDFGAVTYAMTVMLVLSAFAAWGFDAALISGGSARPAMLPTMFRGAQTAKTAIAVPVFLAAGLLLAGDPSVGSWPVLACMLLAGFPELWSQTARSVAAAREVSVGVSLALVAQRIVTAVVVIAILARDGGPVGVAVGFLVGTVAGWLAHVAALRRLDVRLPRLGVRAADLRTATAGTFLLGASGLVLMLLFRLDVVLLGQLRGPHDVAVYSVAYRLLETVLFVTYAVNSAVLPVMSAAAGPDRRRSGFERALAVAGVVYLPFAVVCLVEGHAVLHLFFGEQYAADAAPVLAWLAPAPLFLAAAFFGTSVLTALDRFRALFTAAAVALAVNVVLNLVLIPHLGAPGAAVATTVSYAVQAAVVVVALHRLGERPAVAWPLVSAALGSVLLAVTLVALDAPLLLELAIGGVVFVAGWAVVAGRLAPEQRRLVAELLSRRR